MSELARYNPDDFEAFARNLPDEAAPAAPVELGVVPSQRVQALLENRRVRALFEGRGKTEIGEDGKALDTSSSGYDFSFVFSLAKRGVTDPSELATALACRPDGEARGKGPAYIARTVQRVLARLGNLSDARQVAAAGAASFRIEKVRVLASERSIFELTIHGRTLRFRSSELLSSSKFAARYFDAFHRIPTLPEKWADTVNAWMAGAEVDALPEDASEEVALREAIEAVVEGLSAGESIEDLDVGRSIRHAERGAVFKAAAIMKAIREDFPQAPRSEVCRILRSDLGFESVTITIDGHKVRVWQRNGGSL